MITLPPRQPVVRSKRPPGFKKPLRNDKSSGRWSKGRPCVVLAPARYATSASPVASMKMLPVTAWRPDLFSTMTALMLCTRVGILARGRLMSTGRVADVLAFDIEGLFARLDLLRHLSQTRGNGLRSMVKRIHDTARQFLSLPPDRRYP